jgi:hypothetical protein
MLLLRKIAQAIGARGLLRGYCRLACFLYGHSFLSLSYDPESLLRRETRRGTV